MLPRGAAAATWETEAGAATILTGDGRFMVRVDPDSLSIRRDDEADAWSIPLPGMAATASRDADPSPSN
ncbi:MAG: hypothetical protein EBZ59_06760 [Planctomycetia bacterium]|nr:hypothetical protein [Planctomycetia bacterium]